ncbi:hypothetical protein MUG91_G243n4 [Manis pentadactyla]|nr:hypothetical protein MUG91_G243n4 [Manis pentadactyla]
MISVLPQQLFRGFCFGEHKSDAFLSAEAKSSSEQQEKTATYTPKADVNFKAALIQTAWCHLPKQPKSKSSGEEKREQSNAMTLQTASEEKVCGFFIGFTELLSAQHSPQMPPHIFGSSCFLLRCTQCVFIYLCFLTYYHLVYVLSSHFATPFILERKRNQEWGSATTETSKRQPSVYLKLSSAKGQGTGLTNFSRILHCII